MLSVSNISVQFGSKRLFSGVSFIINRKDRIGLVGSNGSGKTTLMRVINSSVEPDEGEVSRSKHVTVGLLPQDGITFSGKSLYEEVYSSIMDISSLRNEMEEIQVEMEGHPDKNSPDYLELVEELGELQHKFESLDGFRIKSTIEKILMGLGFSASEMNRLTDEFSGGWQMRIALAKLLLKHPSVLLLDEPTNHLDLDSLLWLEGFLDSYDGAVVLVSHDRKFLDNMTNRTVEIYAGRAGFYQGNYSFYLKEKHQARELLEKRYMNQQRYLKQQERFIERFRYKATKASAVQSRIKMLDKLERVELEDEETAIHFMFPGATHSGRKILELRNISKSYGGKAVLRNLNLEVERGNKIGFVGANGAGKSTLARIIIGTEDFQDGERIQGHKVELEYYSQNQAESLEQGLTVLETLDKVAAGDIRKHLRTILGSFLFKGDDVNKQVSVLSGGEKSRLALARMLLKASNFLVLDEPTNHLDMNSKQVLMNALKDYQGTIIVISHDREFLDGIVNRIIEVRDMNIKVYEGNCSYFIMKKNEESSESDSISRKQKTDKASLDAKRGKTKEQKRLEAEKRNELYRLTKPVKVKIEKLELNIKSIEKRLKELESLMNSSTFYDDQQNAVKAGIEFNRLKEELNSNYSEWLIFTEKLKETEERINS